MLSGEAVKSFQGVTSRRQRRRRGSNLVHCQEQRHADESTSTAAQAATPSVMQSSNDLNGSKDYIASNVPLLDDWPQKADLFVMRTDGQSCSRETVAATSGCFSFDYPSTQQHMLVWKTRPSNVLVLKKLGSELQPQFLQVVQYLIDEHDMQVVVEEQELSQLQAELFRVGTFTDAHKSKLHLHIDFVVCLGGDGVILHASALFKRAIPPVISFNLGSLGFLTNHDFEDFRKDLHDVIYGGYDCDECSGPGEVIRGVYITLRMRLLCSVLRRGVQHPDDHYEVMNEVVLDRGSNPYLTKIECWEHGNLITKVQADGVMLATPTGSTAYSVAAGGSMVHPCVPAILFTPICPHSLSFRPVILPDYADVELKVPQDARSSVWVSFDGKQRLELLGGDSIRVRMSPNPVPTIDHLEQTIDWFGSLDRCFGWNDRGAEQQPLRKRNDRAPQC